MPEVDARRCALILLGLLIAILAIVGILAGIVEPENSRGLAHPDVAGMSRGGDAARTDPVLGLGWALGLLEIAVVAVLVRWVVRGPGASLWLSVSFGVMALVWTALVLSYRTWAGSSEVPFFLGFPLPSAWMVYGVWSAPVVLVALYVLGFDRFIFSEVDRARFDALLTELSERAPAGAGGPESEGGAPAERTGSPI